jgi:hypothetical protein
MAIKMPDEALPYGEPYYWDQRYNAERKAHGSHYSFDWYCDLEDLWPVIETYGGEDLAASTDRTLVVGCGNSLVSEQLFAKGFSMIWSVDLCASPRRGPPPRRARATPPAPAAGKVVISFMQARYEDNPQLQPGRDKGATFPTSKAPRSAAVRSFRPRFGRAIVSRSGLDAWTLLPERARTGTLASKRRRVTPRRLQYLVMDARKMDRYPDDYFHLIVEKACLDSLFSSLNSYQEVLRMNQEVCRVLAPGRLFVCVSAAGRDTRTFDATSTCMCCCTMSTCFLDCLKRTRRENTAKHRSNRRRRDRAGEVRRFRRTGRATGRFRRRSYGSPAMRMPHLHHQSLPWRVDCVPLPDKPGVFVYVCTKNAGLSLAQRRRSLTQRKGEDVSVGEVEEEVDLEWEKRKLAPSTVTFKDKYTPGHVRLVRVRDADTLLQALADSVMDKDG